MMMNNLPSLPEGWRYEQHPDDADIIHLVWPDHGAVSVHFKWRTIAPGWCIPHRASGNDFKGGRGWKTALVQEAVDRLKEIWS